jgi:membrane fusion protein (multidrug efflux system)
MKKILFVIIIVVVLAVGVWWLRKPSAAPEADDVKPVAQVQTATLTKEPIGRTLAAYGGVEPSAGGARTVAAAYDCIVRTVDSIVGKRVAAGDLLLTVDPTPDARLQLDSARTVSALAGRSLASVQQRFDLRLATDDDLRTAQQSEQDAQLKMESLVKRGLGDTPGRLTAPVGGIVVKMDAQPGVTVPAGTSLVVIAGSDRLEARISIELSDAGSVRPGQKVVLNAVNRPGGDPVESVVGAVGAFSDATTGSLDVRVPLPKQNSWVPGERVQAEIDIESKVAWVVPRSAVLPDGDEEVLYTVKDGKASKHSVHVGIASGDKLEVSASDLEAGEAVVIQGNYELTDGMAVQVTGPNAGVDGNKNGEDKP